MGAKNSKEKTIAEPKNEGIVMVNEFDVDVDVGEIDDPVGQSVSLLSAITYSALIFFIAGIWSYFLLTISRNYFGMNEMKLSSLFIFAVVVTIIVIGIIVFIGLSK